MGELLHNLQVALQKMRLGDEMCDLHIISKEGTRHPAHSLILAATSPVFKVMVTKDFKELQSKEINLRDVDDSMLNVVLDFIYTGELKMTSENALDLFVIADRLDIIELFFTCVKYIKDHVDVCNCLGMVRLADRFHQQKLKEFAMRYLLQHFQAFADTEDFLDLTFDEFTTLLSQNELNIEKEEYLVDIVFQWIDYNENRVTKLEDLMKCLRYPLMDYDFIGRNIRGHPRWMDNDSMQKLVQRIYKGCFQISQKITTEPDPDLKCLKLQYRLPSQVLFLYGGWNRGCTLDVTECYNIKTRNWYPAKHLKDETEGRSYFDIACMEGNVYVIGGYSGRAYLNTIRCFNPESRTWSSITPMHYRRCFTSAVALGNYLYVIAGFDGSRRLTSVERYSTVTKQWTVMQPMSSPRSDAACVVHNGRIYVFGGYDGDSLNTCMIYSADKDTWYNIASMKVKRSGASAVSIPEENKILVIGGYNGSTRIPTIEYYDPETDSWSLGPQMSQERSNFATCVIENKLFVIGGFTGTSTLRDVEIYDLRTRTWSFGQPLSDGRSALKAVCLDNISNSEYYFQSENQPLDSQHNELYEHNTIGGGASRSRISHGQ